MNRAQYQLLKDNEPIALGSVVHCLDVFYWEIYYGNDHLAYKIVPFSQVEADSEEEAKTIAQEVFNSHPNNVSLPREIIDVVIEEDD